MVAETEIARTWPGAIVYLKDPKSDVWPEKTLTLERVSFSTFGTAAFLTGYKPVGRKQSWWDNGQCWLAVDEIKSMFLYDDAAKWNADREQQEKRWHEQGYDV